MLYYSHINEDSNIEKSLLHASSCTEVIAICGSGERVLALMGSAVKKIIVVDFNEEAIFLLQLKIAALTKLTIDEYLQFIGHLSTKNDFRKQLFEKKIKLHLQNNCRMYWEEKRNEIEKGILNIGHFEKFLKRVRPLINKGLGKDFQKVFTHPFNPLSFPEKRWRILSWLFSQKWIYTLWGNKDLAFIGANANNKQIPEALENTIRNGKAASSFMTHLIFKGHLRDMKDEDLPPTLQKAFLKKIQTKLQTGDLTIEYHVKDLALFLKNSLPSEYIRRFYSLSDILSFEDHHYLTLVLQNVSLKNQFIVVRSFLRNRLKLEQLKYFEKEFGKVEIHDANETSGMYQVISIHMNQSIKREALPNEYQSYSI